MFGGAVIGGVGLRGNLRLRSGGGLRGRPGSGLVLAACVVSASLLGSALAVGVVSGPDVSTLLDLRRVLRVLAGALFFGAGLVQLSAWRLDRGATTRARTGAALVVLGLPTAFLAGLGPLLHVDPVVAILNPLSATIVALAVLVSGPAVGRSAARGHRGPGAVAAGLSLLTGVAFGGMVALRQLSGVSLDPSVPLHLALEVGVAGLWLAAAARAAGRLGGRPFDGTAATELLAGLGCVWLLRGAAALDPAPWGLASAALLLLVGLAALSRAGAEHDAATAAANRRAVAAETALAAATDSLRSWDRHRREVRHEARNVMLALRLASRALTEPGDHLDAATRKRLEIAVREQLEALELVLSRHSQGVVAERSGSAHEGARR